MNLFYEGYNKKTFKEPLPQSEIKATAKSVARWTHKNFSATSFSEWQARQGAKAKSTRLFKP